VQSGVFCWMGALLLLEEVREENLSVNAERLGIIKN
jgi:hypothetical protein